MICPNCSHRENHEFYICPKCHYEIDLDNSSDDGDFDSELESIFGGKDIDFSNSIESIGSDVISEIIDDIIVDNTSLNEVFKLSGLSQKLIARENELYKLRDYYIQARNSNSSSSILVTGAPGVGKSHLITTFIDKIKDDVFLISVRALSGNREIDYTIFKNILQKLISVKEEEPDELKKAKLKKFLKDNTSYHLYGELKAVFYRVLDLDTEQYVEKMDAISYDRILKRSFRQIFTSIAEKNKLFIIAIKNLHNADQKSIDIIDYFVSLPSYKNTIFLASSEIQENIKVFLKGDSKRYNMKLNALDEKGAYLMTANILKDLKLDNVIIKFISRNSQGNPLFIVESIRYLIDKNIIAIENDKFISIDKKRLKEIRIPTTIEQAIYSKLKRLPKIDFIIIQLATICGRLFHSRALKVLVNVDKYVIKNKNRLKYCNFKDNEVDNKIKESLDNLIKWGIISVKYNSRYEDLDYRFNNELEYKIFYNSIKKENKKIYHSYLGQYFESRIDNKNERNNELISYQYKKAGNNYLASKYFLISAKNHSKRYDNSKAIKLYTEALKLTSDKNILRKIEILHNLGTLYDVVGRPNNALIAFLEMGKLANIILFESKIGASYNKLGRIYRELGEFNKALIHLKKAYDYFTNSMDKRGIASTLDDIGNVYWRKRKFNEALEHYMNSLKIRKNIKESKVIALSLNNIGMLYYSQGYMKEAEEYLYEAYKLRIDIKDKYGEMTSLDSLASLIFSRGDDIESKALWLKALSLAEEIGNVNFQAMIMVNLAELFIEVENFTEAKNHLQDALEIILESANKKILSKIYLFIGILNIEISEIDEALLYLNKSLELAEEIKNNETIGRVYCKLGEIESKTLFGDNDEQISKSEDYYLRSLDLLRRVSEPLMAETYISYSEYLLSEGKTGKAKKLMLKAEKIYKNFDMKLKLNKLIKFKEQLS